MRTPREPDDRAAASIRRERDRILDSHYGALRPLDRFPKQRPGSDVDRVPLPEIAYYPPKGVHPGTTVVVATFNDFDVILSESRRTIYTEQQLLVERVLDARHPAVLPGQTLIALEHGGTALVGVQVIEYETQPRAEVLVPQHRYVLFLYGLPEADCYQVSKAWELLEGKAQPVSLEDVERAEKGVSRYAGMSEAEFLSAVQREIRNLDEKARIGGGGGS